MAKVPVGTLVIYPQALTSVIILPDGKHFRIGKRPHTLYVAQDGSTGAPFAWVLLPRHELKAGYGQILDWMKANEYVCEAVVSDGHKGLAASVLDHYPKAIHQRCAAHVLRTALRKLGGRWFLGMKERRALWKEVNLAVLRQAHQEDAAEHLAWITSIMPAYLQEKWAKALDVLMVSLSDLYAFEQRPELGIPRTSNRMEALMGSLQQRLKTCRGFENAETLTSLVSSLLARKYQPKSETEPDLSLTNIALARVVD